MNGKFKEYAVMVGRGVLNLDKVIASRWNKALAAFDQLDPAKQAEADRRLQICLECPFNSLKAKTSPEFKGLYDGNYFTFRPDSDIHCAICSCPLEDKVLSMDEECGLKLYNLQHPDREPQPLKWEAFIG